MGGLLDLVQRERPGRAAVPPSPLLAIPNVTAHPSTASVPIIVLLYNGPLLCGSSVATKGLTVRLLYRWDNKHTVCSLLAVLQLSTLSFQTTERARACYHYHTDAVLSVRLSVCHIPVFCRNDLTHCHNFFTTRQLSHSGFMSIKRLSEIQTWSSVGALDTGVV